MNLEEMLRDPAWLRDVVLELDQSDLTLGLRLVVRLHRDERYIRICIPTAVDGVSVVARK